METDLELSQHYKLIEQAIQYIERNLQHQPELQKVAAAVGLSEYHFQRLFTAWAGISPKRFMQFLTKEHAKQLLKDSENVLGATHKTGLSSLGRLHDLFIHTEAVTPGQYKSGGAGLVIRHGIHPSPFGKILLAATERGICKLSFVEGHEHQAIDDLAEEWPQAQLINDTAHTAPLAMQIFLEVSTRLKPSPKLNLPLRLHLRGTNFQIKVWEALLGIPFGSVSTYEQIATQIGIPQAVRAVGTAVGHNPIAYLIPCHRVIRKSGEFGNYLYGTARKKIILAKEYSAFRDHTS